MLMMPTVLATFLKHMQCRPELTVLGLSAKNVGCIITSPRSHEVLRKRHFYPRAHVGVQTGQSCRPISQPGWFTKLCAVTSAVRNARAEQGIAPKAAHRASRITCSGSDLCISAAPAALADLTCFGFVYSQKLTKTQNSDLFLSGSDQLLPRSACP